jgi:predicted ribosome quality control (RQC) complex YloA/Tae2 family protein
VRQYVFFDLTIFYILIIENNSKTNSPEKQAETLREADLLTSFLHTWKVKDSHVTCLDFETQEEVKILIPYGSTPMMVAKKLYNNAKKLRRSEDILDVLINKVSGYLLYMSEINASLDALDKFRSHEDITALKEISSELDAVQTALYSIYNNAQQENGSNNYIVSNSKSESTVKHSHQKQKKVKSKSTILVSPNSQDQSPAVATRKSLKGLLVLENRNVDKELSPFRVPVVVGRNSKQNDRVSFDIARSHHIWFHVQGSPGSHCLLLLQPGEQVLGDQIQSAADVAAFYSKARGSKNVISP